MKTIDELRKGFEETKTFKKCSHWSLGFSNITKMYVSEPIAYISHAIVMNAAWEMYKELNK